MFTLKSNSGDKQEKRLHSWQMAWLVSNKGWLGRNFTIFELSLKTPKNTKRLFKNFIEIFRSPKGEPEFLRESAKTKILALQTGLAIGLAGVSVKLMGLENSQNAKIRPKTDLAPLRTRKILVR